MRKPQPLNQRKILYYKKQIYLKIKTGKKTVYQLVQYKGTFVNKEWAIAIAAAKKWAQKLVRKQREREAQARLQKLTTSIEQGASLRKKSPKRFSTEPTFKSKEPSQYRPPSKMGQRLH